MHPQPPSVTLATAKGTLLETMVEDREVTTSVAEKSILEGKSDFMAASRSKN